MTFYIGRAGIKLDFLFFILFAYMLSLEIGKYYLTTLFYAFIHESVHILLISKLYDGRFDITIGIFGIRLNYDDSVRLTLKNEAGIAFSAPCVNLTLAGLFRILFLIFPESEFIKASFAINASLAFFNLLPVMPLDGGVFLYNCICMKHAKETADFALSCLGAFTLIVFSVFCISFKLKTLGVISFLYIASAFVLTQLKKR